MLIEIIDGVFVLSAGTMTLILWLIVIIKKQGHKFIEKPFERLFHIIAESVMAIISIVGGIALLLEQMWALHMFFLAMGLLLYATVNAIGIYGEKKNMLLTSILISSALITLILIIVSSVLLVL
jgi:hypothetical protein